MCGYFCIGFIDFMLQGESLTDFAIPFSGNNFKTNDDIILNYFNKYLKFQVWKKIILFFKV